MASSSSTAVESEGTVAVLEGLSRVQPSHGAGIPPDFILSCRGHAWLVHKEILKLHSEVFSTMISSSSSKQCQNNSLPLDSEFPEVIDQFVHYLYDLEYSATWYAAPPITFHRLMSALAKKYSIHHLAEEADAQVEKLTTPRWQRKVYGLRAGRGSVSMTG